MVAAAEKKASVFTCPDSQMYGFYNATKKKELAKTLQMEPVIILTFGVFDWHRYLQHAGEEWEGSLCLCNCA